MVTARVAAPLHQRHRRRHNSPTVEQKQRGGRELSPQPHALPEEAEVIPVAVAFGRAEGGGPTLNCLFQSTHRCKDSSLAGRHRGGGRGERYAAGAHIGLP